MMPRTRTTLTKQLAQVFAWLLCVAATSTSAGVASNDPEQDVINHIVAIEGIRAIQQDANCAYAAKKMQLPSFPYREVTIKLSDSARRDIEMELQNPSTKSKLSALGIAGKDVMQRLAPGGLDQKTLCGIWFGYAMTEYARTARKLGLVK